ncbi:uncharacterized protein LOC119278721 isoform X1 [Triticum dicoccoides]|uniref:uncharacterized protein LOC119278721 isoform X1 n=1 Tax=Triticum dicoccoides TaxID=85692 RepID=UPI0018907B71|nr:uncharacterized protein LOC119278721 isoform X1 [Triticum dicoccoides]
MLAPVHVDGIVAEGLLPGEPRPASVSTRGHANKIDLNACLLMCVCGCCWLLLLCTSAWFRFDMSGLKYAPELKKYLERHCRDGLRPVGSWLFQLEQYLRCILHLPYHGVVADIGGGLGGLAQNGILERSETNQLWSVGRGACRFVLEGAREPVATGKGAKEASVAPEQQFQ